MFVCQRCRAEFEQEVSLKRHLTRQDIPCDLFCSKCGKYVSSRYIYLKHKTNMCKSLKPGKPMKSIESNNNETSDIINETMGIYPLEYDNDIILHTHKKTLNDMLMQYLDHNDINNLIIQIVRVFYSNQRFLQHSNIIATSNDSNDLVYKIHNGREFIDDIMSKTIRNNRVIQIILVHLSEFCEFIDVDKKVKSFVNNIMIPQLVHGYYMGTFQDSLNDLWITNSQYWERIQKFVPNRYGILTKEKMMEQIDQYYENEKTMSKMFLSNHTKETSKIIKSIKDKINNFIK